MNYYEFIFTVTSEEEFHRDLLINALSEAGFDTFEETSSGFNAYIPTNEFSQEKLDQALLGFEDMFEFSFERNLIPQKNWNEVWESNFEPLVIKDQCYVRATFHAPHPEYPYEIVIDPKMSFGTGHHQTTAMMMEYLLEEDVAGEAVLDMGCGTGILAILSSKLGASNIVAIDYDPLCYNSSLENIEINHTKNIEVICGSKEVIPSTTFQLVLANINRNILLEQIERYSEVLAADGTLFMSGFYEEDVPVLRNAAERQGLSMVSSKSLNNWCSVKFIKKNLN